MIRTEAIERLKRCEGDLRALGATSLFLFGSTARDEATAISDIDVFIDVDPAAKFSLFDLVHAKHMVEDALAVSVDLGTRDGLHPRLRAAIETSAIQIF